MGGSSAINAQALIPPSSASIDAWAELGNPGWNWLTLKPYFQKFHTLTSPSEEIKKYLSINYLEENIRGKTGPIKASFPDNAAENVLAKAWVDTFKSLGYGITGDPFSGKVSGGFVSASTVDSVSKERSYAASAYYAPAKDRPNLHLITDALVEKVLLEYIDDPTINNDDGRYSASIVQYMHEGQVKMAKANKEVVLCAGAIQSPQILELSGIGDRKLLESHGIKVLIDNPNVGENLQDHLFTGLSYEVKDGIATADILRRDSKAAQAAMAEYMSKKTGPMTSTAMAAFAFMPIVDFLTPGDDAGPAALKQLLDKHLPDNPTIHHGFIRSILQDPSESSASMFMTPVYAKLSTEPIIPNSTTTQSVPEGNYITICTSILQPFSRGSTHISSPSAYSPPLINPAYLSHPLDAELFAYHILFLETIASTDPLASFLKPSGRRNPAAPPLRSLEEAKKFLRASAISNWHPTSSCTMLPREAGGVVDARLRVYGTKNLRVVDASVLPIVPRGNPQSSVYAVAERAVDLIREDHLQSAGL